MTVKELIERLQKLPPDLHVSVRDSLTPVDDYLVGSVEIEASDNPNDKGSIYEKMVYIGE